MEGVPQNIGYMYLGYGVIFGFMAVYLGSLFIRFRNLRQDERTLDELEKQE